MPLPGDEPRSMEVDEVWFFTIVQGRLDRMWALEDTWARLLQLGTAQQAMQAPGVAQSS